MPVLALIISVVIFSVDIAMSNIYMNKIIKITESTEKVMESSIKNLPKFDSFPFKIIQVRNVVSQSRTELEVEMYKLNRINLLFFGNEFRDVIDAYSDHADAWIDFYKRAEGCIDYNCYVTEVRKPTQISPTFEIAKVAYLEATPIIDIHNLERRVNIIFAN